MSQYANLDCAILAHITSRREPKPLYARDVRIVADPLAEATGREVCRVIDGRLTALKKAGRIHFDKALRLWRPVAEQPQGEGEKA